MLLSVELWPVEEVDGFVFLHGEEHCLCGINFVVRMFLVGCRDDHIIGD
jgi:hypothetical protein